MATSSQWRVEDLQQMEEYGLAGQLESTTLEAGGAEGSGRGHCDGEQDWYGMSAVLSGLLDVQAPPHLPFLLSPLPAAALSHHSGVQVVLSAPTAYGIKVGGEILTYINKGQPYDVLLDANIQDRDPAEDTIYKCVLSLGFSELRMRNSEKELFEYWGQDHPCERLLEIDKRGCSGLTSIQNEEMTNVVSCLWQPVQRGILSVKLNCLSSEFSPKKHGGEKGIILQLCVNVYSVTPVTPDSCETHLLHAACSLKVFKDKGGDRKQKTDQMRMDKLSPSEKAKYLPSLEVTGFIPHFLNTMSSRTPGLCLTPHNPTTAATENSTSPQTLHSSFQSDSPLSPLVAETPLKLIADQKADEDMVSPMEETQQWLTSHNFSLYLQLFANYRLSDLLRLSRRDVVELCGLADGVRLFNSLRNRALCTVYVTEERDSVYQAVCLRDLTYQELLTQLCGKLGLQPTQVSSVLQLTACGVYVIVDDMLVENLRDEDCFVVQSVKEEESDQYRLVLRPNCPPSLNNGLGLGGTSPGTPSLQH